MSSFNLLNLGVQATQANKTALSVVGQNISNVNTAGYNRQVAHMVTITDQRGVQVDSINRITDDFLTRQLWADSSAYSRTDVFADLATQLDNLLATGSTSVSTAMDQYFNALQNAVDDPTSLPNRELFIAEAEALTRRFNELNSSIVRQNEQINENLESLAQQVTTLGKDIANLNDKIRLNVVAGKPANELRDQRDLLVEELASLIDIQVVEQGVDEFAVFIGKGQPLVVGINAGEVIAIQGNPDPSQAGLALKIGGGADDVTDNMVGGKIGGLLEYRTEVLTPAINELGRIAVAFADSMNQQHLKGMDLEGNLGGLLFNDVNTYSAMSSRLTANTDNESQASLGIVRIVDASALQASDYEITFNDSGQFTVERLSDGKRFSLSQFTQVAESVPPVVPPRPEDPLTESGTRFFDENSGYLQLSLDGFTLELDVAGKFIQGDRFLVQPTRHGAAEIDTVVTDGRQLALASPVRILTSPDNTGTGVAEVKVTDIDDSVFQSSAGALSPEVEIVFNNDGTYSVYDISTTPGYPQLLDNQPFVAGDAIDMGGYEVVIRNQPRAGDRFTLEYNTDGVSDNRNALALSNLQLADTLESGSYQDIYGKLIERVGTKTSVAEINRNASKSVLKSTQDTKASLSGVNLDEEAAKLVQFQQAYQASAQLISASQVLFDTLLSTVRS